MLRITDVDTANNYRVLTHSPDVFHKALKEVLNGGSFVCDDVVRELMLRGALSEKKEKSV